MPKTFKPWPYQERACQWILDHHNCGLLLDMGLGKTVTTLTAISKLYDDFAISHVLVVAPLRVALTVWAEEAQKWEHLKDLTFSKILGARQQRIDAIRRQADVYIINRENLNWLVEYFRTEPKLKWPFDCVVIDELSSFKSAQAARFKALRRVRPHIHRMIGLTGTPAPNGLLDLFAEVYILDGGERLGKTLTGYRDRYFLPGKRNGNIVYEWKLKPGADQAIYQRLEDLCISMTAADYLEMPDKLELVERVELERASRKVYDRMERDMLVALDEETITAASAAVVTNKLLQLANGAIYDESHQVHQVHDAKLDKLEDLIEAANGQPVLVYYAFQHDRDRILERINNCRCLETAKDVEAWNRGEIPVMLAHPASAGHGLNLQAGGHILVWFGLTWSLELYQQANARLYRQGQEQAVQIYHIVAAGTMDEQVMKMLDAKDQRQMTLIDALKDRRCRV